MCYFIIQKYILKTYVQYLYLIFLSRLVLRLIYFKNYFISISLIIIEFLLIFTCYDNDLTLSQRVTHYCVARDVNLLNRSLCMQEIFLHDFLVILKLSLQIYQKTMKKYFSVIDSSESCTNNCMDVFDSNYRKKTNQRSSEFLNPYIIREELFLVVRAYLYAP